MPVLAPRLFGTAIPAFGVVAFAAPRMASFLDTLCDSSSASVAASCHFHSLHAHSCMRTAACAQLHAHSCMLTAACAQPFNTQDAVETWIGIPVILVEPSGSQLSAVDQQPSDIVSNKMRIGCAFSGLEL